MSTFPDGDVNTNNTKKDTKHTQANCQRQIINFVLSTGLMSQDVPHNGRDNKDDNGCKTAAANGVDESKISYKNGNRGQTKEHEDCQHVQIPTSLPLGWYIQHIQNTIPTTNKYNWIRRQRRNPDGQSAHSR